MAAPVGVWTTLSVQPTFPRCSHIQHIDYATLPKANVITPISSEADVRVEVGCSHHVICYCAELDYQYTKTTPQSPVDRGPYKCVLGPREFSANEVLAELLALSFKALIANQDMLKQVAKRMGWRPE